MRRLTIGAAKNATQINDAVMCAQQGWASCPLTQNGCLRIMAHGAAQLTDIYLLALATAHGGRLVTFDARIPLPAVPAATRANLLVL